MPSYTFESKTTGEQHTVVLSFAERDEYEKNHPDLFQVISRSPLIDPTKLGLKKPDDGFREVLRRIQSNHPLSNGINSF